jgi:HEAT repeat protein
MGKQNLHELVDDLAVWQSSDYGHGDVPSLRDQAIVELKKTGPRAVPVLIKRLEDLLTTSAEHRARVDAVQAAWTAWYQESDELMDEYGLGADIERHRTIPTADLPEQSPRDENYRDPYSLRTGIVNALHELGDERAAPVLTAALSDPACIPDAARALCDIHFDAAGPALLDAVTLVDHTANTGIVFDPLFAALRHYGVTLAQARERFDAETSPQGRVRLMHLMTTLPEDGTGRPAETEIRDALVFLALDDRDESGRWRAIEALNRLDNRPDERDIVSDWDAPPPVHVIRAAIALAAHGKPPGHDRELTSRLRRIRHTAPAMRAVEAVLSESPEPDAAELGLALRLALGVRSDVDEPVPLLRALHRLSAHPEVGTLATTVLRRTGWELLYPQLIHQDEARRREARAIFDAIATPAEHRHFAGFVGSQPFVRRLRIKLRRG